MFNIIKKLKAFIDSKYCKWEEGSLKTDEQKIKYHAVNILEIANKYDCRDHVSIWDFTEFRKVEFLDKSGKFITFDLDSGKREEEEC